MRSITVVGRVSSEILKRSPNFAAAIQCEENIYPVFVMRQEYDFPIGTVFRIHQGTMTNTFELIAVTQQFDKPMDAIPHGWKTICALKLLENPLSILAGLPFTDDWYGNETTLVLEEIAYPR